MSPVAPAHAERVALLNRIYEQMERDTDGESPAEQERLYRAADGDGDWMRLYVEHKGTPVGGRYVSITVAFLPLPGLRLHAARHRRGPAMTEGRGQS